MGREDHAVSSRYTSKCGNADSNSDRTMDVAMLQLLNARERDEKDYAELFQTADPRFKFTGARTTKGCRMHIMEAIWHPEAFQFLRGGMKW